MQNKLLKPCDFSVSPWESAAVPRKSLCTHFYTSFVPFSSVVLRESLLVKCSEEFGSKQVCKCKELYPLWDTTQTLGKPHFTWKQLVAQETDIIEDQSVHWEVIWRAQRPPVTSEQTTQRLWNSVHFAMLCTAEERFQSQKNPADIQEVPFLCFQGHLVSHILLSLPGLMFGGLLPIYRVSLTTSMTGKFSHAHAYFLFYEGI